jgi:hypothetical protein
MFVRHANSSRSRAFRSAADREALPNSPFWRRYKQFILLKIEVRRCILTLILRSVLVRID